MFVGSILSVLRACPQAKHDPVDLSSGDSLKIRVNKLNSTIPEELHHPVKAWCYFVGTLAQSVGKREVQMPVKSWVMWVGIGGATCVPGT